MDIQLVLGRLVAAAQVVTLTPARAVTAYDYVPDNIQPPCVFPESVETNFDQTMGRGTDKITVRLRFLCARTDDREGQHMLYGALDGSGASSVKTAIEAARGVPGVGALGGACDDLHVKSVGETRWYEHAGVRFVGVDFLVDVWGDGA